MAVIVDLILADYARIRERFAEVDDTAGSAREKRPSAAWTTCPPNTRSYLPLDRSWSAHRKPGRDHRRRHRRPRQGDPPVPVLGKESFLGALCSSGSAGAAQAQLTQLAGIHLNRMRPAQPDKWHHPRTGELPWRASCDIRGIPGSS